MDSHVTISCHHSHSQRHKEKVYIGSPLPDTEAIAHIKTLTEYLAGQNTHFTNCKLFEIHDCKVFEVCIS